MLSSGDLGIYVKENKLDEEDQSVYIFNPLGTFYLQKLQHSDSWNVRYKILNINPVSSTEDEVGRS